MKVVGLYHLIQKTTQGGTFYSGDDFQNPSVFVSAKMPPCHLFFNLGGGFKFQLFFILGKMDPIWRAYFFSDGLVKNHHLEMGVSKNRVFFPQIIHVNKVFHYKPSILEYHHFRKHPNVWMPGTGTCQCLWEDYSVDRLSLEGPGEVWRVAKVWSTWGGLTPWKLTWHWKITIFNRKYIFIHGRFSIVMLVFGDVTGWWFSFFLNFHPKPWEPRAQ